MKQLLPVTLQHLGDGYSGPLGDYLRNVLTVHFFLQQRLAVLHGLELTLVVLQLLLCLDNLAVPDLRHLAEFARSFEAFGLRLVCVDIFLLLSDPLDDRLFVFPFGFQIAALAFEIRNFLT